MGTFYKKPIQKTRSKGASQKKHASRRFSERFGERLTKAIHDQILDMIQSGKSKLIEKQSARVSLHELTYNGEKMRVVYDKNRNQIVTFMHAEAE